MTILLLAILAGADDLAGRLRELDGRVIVRGTVRQPPLASMLARDVEARLRLANAADRSAWAAVKTLADWERYRDRRLAALRASLGDFPPVPKGMKARVVRTLEGDGYRVDALLYETRPGLWVTANLYRPARPAASMPGLIVCHSHQSSKHTGWRQDMGMTWARAGCVVLIPDHLGHGERRQHPFGEERPYDYHGRYDLGIQLHLVGESLMGWMAWDLMRGTDVLLAHKGVDPARVVLLSEPAGGGDVAAVTAALDRRITAVMVQNFGGPQPETPYPLPPDAEASFPYAGAGSWESTRNLRRSAADGFLPWLIVAAAAPRRTVYYHEFYWDRERDPVWERLRRVHALYGAKDTLTGLAGHGFVVGSEPENTHWLPASRELLYPTLQRWFRIPDPKKEYSRRRPAEELLCWTPDLMKELTPRPVHELAARLAGRRAPAKPREAWADLLGDVAPAAKPVVVGERREALVGVTVERVHLGTDPGTVVPVLLLVPPAKGRVPVAVCVAQEGKQGWLRHRPGPVAALLAAGVAVCLPDVRGTGETSPGPDRGRRGAAVPASELMLGQTLLGGRLRDLRTVLAYLRGRADVDPGRVALWGDSFAPVNPPGRDLTRPHDGADRPAPCEPLGGLLALLGALYEDGVRAVYVHRGLSDYRSLLNGPMPHVPYDAVLPGVLRAGDLCDLTVALAPRPVWLRGMVDGLNRAVPDAELRRRYPGAGEGLRIGGEGDPAAWLAERLKR